MFQLSVRPQLVHVRLSTEVRPSLHRHYLGSSLLTNALKCPIPGCQPVRLPMQWNPLLWPDACAPALSMLMEGAPPMLSVEPSSDSSPHVTVALLVPGSTTNPAQASKGTRRAAA